jgi:ribokinase
VMIKHNINCKYVSCTETPSGHAIIQVTPSGENAIVLFGGANHELTTQDLMQALDDVKSTDWVLTQNETNAVDEVLKQAKAKGLKVAFNPAPMTESVKTLPHECIDLLIVNEIEAHEISGCTELAQMENYFRQKWPATEVIITLGKAGACMLRKDLTITVPAYEVEAIDTTAAGDTFIGFFLSAYSEHCDAKSALTRACAASALAVTQLGAAQSIPDTKQVDRFLAKYNN